MRKLNQKYKVGQVNCPNIDKQSDYGHQNDYIRDFPNKIIVLGLGDKQNDYGHYIRDFPNHDVKECCTRTKAIPFYHKQLHHS